jgi:hypothetical protein
MILGIYNIQESQNVRIGRNFKIIWSKHSFYRCGRLLRVKRQRELMVNTRALEEVRKETTHHT